MSRVDDSKLNGNILLYRRIPPWPDNVTWDDSGVPSFSSLNFNDKDSELSVNIASETTPDEVLAGHEGFGLIQFTAAQVRACCGADIVLCRCVEEPAMGHSLICGKLSKTSRKNLQKQAVWVEKKWPSRNPPEQGGKSIGPN
jgi:hypothetical protein